jgi:hypothetical protein
VIVAGDLAPAKTDSDEPAVEMMNKILGGDFTSRINMNLREDKHWTYGARTSIAGARGQRLFWASVAVQSDRTRETMGELQRELSDIVNMRPITEAEFTRVVNNQTMRLAGSWETIGSVAQSVAEIVRFGLPDTYFQTYAADLLALKRERLCEAARRVVQPHGLVWVVVGDRTKIETPSAARASERSASSMRTDIRSLRSASSSTGGVLLPQNFGQGCDDVFLVGAFGFDFEGRAQRGAQGQKLKDRTGVCAGQSRLQRIFTVPPDFCAILATCDATLKWSPSLQRTVTLLRFIGCLLSLRLI